MNIHDDIGNELGYLHEPAPELGEQLKQKKPEEEPWVNITQEDINEDNLPGSTPLVPGLD